MNKYYIEGVLVVEGKDDVSYLSSFISTLFFTTNGYDVSNEKLEFLERVAKVNRIIVLTDNDNAGKEIENRIKTKINGVFVRKSKKITRKVTKKSGVAETCEDAIVDALSDFIEQDNGQFKRIDYNLNSIISLSENPAKVKIDIIKDYRLINGNIKFLQNQLQMLRINPKEIESKYGN